MKTAKNTVTAPKAPKARKATTADLNARAMAKVEEAKASKAKAAAKAEGTPILTLDQTAAVNTMIGAAQSVEGSTRKAAQAIHAVYALGIHTLHGMPLGKFVAKTLTGAGIAKATAYYLKDIGEAYSVLGAERANLFPMEGLRTIAAAAKGDRAKVEAMATDAQSGDEAVAPSLENCRKAAKGGTAGLTRDQMVAALAKRALKFAADDAAAALALLDAAAARIAAAEAAKEAAEEDAED